MSSAAEDASDRSRPDPRYVEARRVLLDALVGLQAHAHSLTLVGAQAVYLRTGDSDIAVAPYTTDGDLVIDPTGLANDPAIEAAMDAAGFRLSIVNGHPEPGVWVARATVAGDEFLVPVDLIVPEGVAPPGGRRGARLGAHGNRAAHRAVGLEAAIVDRSPVLITALDPLDARSVTVDVAGVAALLVAKAHKIHDRVAGGRPGRVGDKDGADVVRIMQTAPVGSVAETWRGLEGHPVAAEPTRAARDYMIDLFGRRGVPGSRWLLARFGWG